METTAPARPAAPGLPPALRRLLPFLRWWPRVSGRGARQDLIAGLTGAIVVLPQGVAFATIAGMPPEYGLYAGMVPAVIAALFDSSWHLVSGPTTAASIVLYSVLSQHAEPGTAAYVQLALTLTFMVGIVQLGLGLARLGVLINFISHSVVIGFTAGAAVLIATSQAKNFFGLPIPRGTSFHDTWITVVSRFAEANPYVLGVAGFTLVLGIVARRFMPKMPYMLVAMLGGSFLAVGLKAFGGQGATAITTIGALPGKLPPLSAPSFTSDTWSHLATASLAVSLLALTEAVSIARALAVRSGQQIDGNQEFIGQGLSNLIGAFFSSYVATGSFNRSGLNYASGAQTPLSSVFASVILVAIVLLVSPLAAYLPQAAMAGVLFLVAWGLIDFHHIGQILKSGREETIILASTFLATLFVSLESAILLGVILSLAFYLARTSRPRVVTRVPDSRTDGQRRFSDDPALPECPQLKIVRIDGSLYFGSVSHVQETLAAMAEAQPAQKHLAIAASGINFVDISGAEFLVREAKRRRAAGGALHLMKVKPQVLEALENGYLEEIGGGNIYQGKGEAIFRIHAQLDRSICQECDRGVFRECHAATAAAAEAQAGASRMHPA